MWVFTKIGPFSLGSDPFNPDQLIVQSQRREELDRFVSLLDEIGEERHEIQPTAEDGYRFLAMANAMSSP